MRKGTYSAIGLENNLRLFDKLRIYLQLNNSGACFT